jgi:hypothetical protein
MPARGISGTGLLRHVLKASSPVERLIICSPGQGPMMAWMPGCRGRAWQPRSVVIISRARRGTDCWVCYGLGALGRRRMRPPLRRNYGPRMPPARAATGSATYILGHPGPPPEDHSSVRLWAHGAWTSSIAASCSAMIPASPPRLDDLMSRRSTRAAEAAVQPCCRRRIGPAGPGGMRPPLSAE